MLARHCAALPVRGEHYKPFLGGVSCDGYAVVCVQFGRNCNIVCVGKVGKRFARLGLKALQKTNGHLRRSDGVQLKQISEASLMLL